MANAAGDHDPSVRVDRYLGSGRAQMIEPRGHLPMMSERLPREAYSRQAKPKGLPQPRWNAALGRGGPPFYGEPGTIKVKDAGVQARRELGGGLHRIDWCVQTSPRRHAESVSISLGLWLRAVGWDRSAQ